MTRPRKINLLCTDSDRECFEPIKKQLAERGFSAERTGPVRKNGIVLALLTETFYSDDTLKKQLLSLIGSGAAEVLPLRLDDTPIPDEIKNALYVRNIIPAAGRDASQIAERIVSAVPKKKSRLPLLLSAAGIVLLAVVGLLIWRAARSGGDLPAADTDRPAVIPPALGITEEDLGSIENVVIVGDQIAFFQSFEIKTFTTNSDILFMPEDAFQSWDHFAYLDEWNDVHWYSKETGQELGKARWEDLRFIGLMPNLRSLTMVLVDADAPTLPDLRGAEKLERVDIESCVFDTLDWMAGSSAEELTVRFTPVRDFGPLTACENLKRVSVDMYGQTVETAFSGFAPRELDDLWLWHANSGGQLDLSSLHGCEQLRQVTFGDLPLRDLSCLEEARQLNQLMLSEMSAIRDLSGIEGLPIEYLEIKNSDSVRDIRAVGELEKLRRLRIESCGRLTDFSPAGECGELESFYVWGMHGNVRDVSFLSGLGNLRTIELFDVDLPNMDFLSGFSGRSDLNLAFSGNIRDYSGLSNVKSYRMLHVNPANGNLELVLPYLEGVTTGLLHLHNCRGIDLSRLPTVTETLEIWNGDLRDLSGIPDLTISHLLLYDLPYLDSLEGIENLRYYSDEKRDTNLYVVGCPRLQDWSAVEGLHLNELRLEHVYSLPDLSAVDFSSLLIEGVDSLTDLRFLGVKPEGWHYEWIRLINVNGLTDLTPLTRLNGQRLSVDPALAEQAEELKRKECIQDYSIEYPDGSWQPFDGEVKLLSLDELDTLPESLLRNVRRLCVIGDQLVDMEEFDFRWDWEDEEKLPTVVLYDRDTGEERALDYAEGTLTDLNQLAKLSGLRDLCLFEQPLENLNGIQNLGELEALRTICCPSLRDVSAAFACQEIRYLAADRCPVGNIEGIQNLSGLVELNINGTQVRDLSPLNGCDLSAAEEERGGLSLFVSNVPIEDYSPLAALGSLDNLDINDVDPQHFVPFLEGVSLRRLSACGCFRTDSGGGDPNALFAELVYAHPELEELWIPWNTGITDLAPLLELEGLKYVRISHDMKAAIESLGGAELHFDLEVEGQ